MNKLIPLIIEDIKNSQNYKSSHWKKFTKDFILYENKVVGIHGFGGNKNRTFIRQVIHDFFQLLFFSNIDDFYRSSFYNLGRKITKVQKRLFDLDVLRHVFTFEFLNKNLLSTTKFKTCCVIGDGQTNFVSIALEKGLFEKVISINLPEILINDLFLLNKSGDKNQNIQYVSNSNSLIKALGDKKTQLILIPANAMSILNNKEIDLFINIASMQEMTNKVIKKYFSIIKSNNSFFYCCNREKKTLPDGEIIDFYRYNWGNCKIIVDEECEWHKFFYKVSYNLKFKKYYDGKHIHRIVKF